MTLNTRELKKDCAYRRIMEMIRLGRVTNGRFPSEPEFCKELNVSRVTLRAALKRLEQEGMITRSHYYGTRISSTRPMRKVLIADVASNYRFCDRKMQDRNDRGPASESVSCGWAFRKSRPARIFAVRRHFPALKYRWMLSSSSRPRRIRCASCFLRLAS